jgi:thioredoxin 1
MSKVQQISTADFDNEVLQAEVPVLVDFYATWCMPCRMLAPALEKVAGELEGKAKILKVDVDQDPELASAHQIQGVPTLKIFHRGRVEETVVGLVPPQTLKEKLECVA